MHGAQQELHYFQKGENDMREQMKLKMKIRLALQLQYYRILFLLGLKSEEIYYIGGSEALPHR